MSPPARAGDGPSPREIDTSAAVSTVTRIEVDSAAGLESVSGLETDAVSVIVPTELTPVWTAIVTVAEAPAGIVPRETPDTPPPDIGMTKPWLVVSDTSDTPA